ncbi:MAG: GNAT family N-acetyltransferase [Comamonadaceae bacterium]|nr:GNAT family N-acetyltransferase [Comamonadaceae bacterium]
MTGRYVIREHQAVDLQALRKLFVESRDAAFPWVSAGRHQEVDFDVTTAGELVLVAFASNVEVNAVPLGFASIWEPDGFLHNLFVHPSAQRRGVGSALLAACAPYFGHHTPTLKCLRANESATRFYLTRGWRLQSEGEGPEGPFLLMRKIATDV